MGVMPLLVSRSRIWGARAEQVGEEGQEMEDTAVKSPWQPRSTSKYERDKRKNEGQKQMSPPSKPNLGNSLAVQLLGLCASTAEGLD